MGTLKTDADHLLLVLFHGFFRELGNVRHSTAVASVVDYIKIHVAEGEKTGILPAVALSEN